MKRFYKIFIIIFVFLGIGVITGYYVLTEKNIINFIQKQVYKRTGDNVSVSNIKVNYKKGLLIKVENLKIFNNTETLANIEKASINLDLKKILKKTIYLQSLKIINGNIDFNFEKIISKKNSHFVKKTAQKKSSKKFKIFVKNIDINNLNINTNVSEEKVKFSILTLNLNNFSLNKHFTFNLISNLNVKNSKGRLVAKGNVFLPESKVNIKIGADNLNLEFLKVFGINISNCNINGEISGSLKHNISSHLNILANNLSLTKFHNIYFNNLMLNFNFLINNKDILITKSSIDLDNSSIKIITKGKITDFNYFDLKFSSNDISSKYLKNFLPLKHKITISDNAKFKISNSSVKGSLKDLENMEINTNFSVSKLSGNFENYNISNVSLNGHYDNKKLLIKDIKACINNTKINNLDISLRNKELSGKGDFQVDLSDIPAVDKFLTLHRGVLHLSLKSFFIPLNDFSKTKLKFNGKFSMQDGLISYSFFRKIRIDNFEGDFNENIINLKKSQVNFRGNDYKLIGNVKHYMVNPVTFDFDISSNIFDRFIADNLMQIKIGTCKNILAKVHLKGNINEKFKIRLTRGNIEFFNSNVNIEGFDLKNIVGKADLNNDVVNINNIFLTFNKGHYNINGKVFSPFEDKKMDLIVKGDKIDKILTDKLNINELHNLNIVAHIKGNFDKLILKSAFLQFHGTELLYNEYKLKNITGSIKYEKNVANIKNLETYMNKIKYIVNGKIFYPFENLSYSLNIKTTSIDSYFLKKIKLTIPTIRHLLADINISGNIRKNLNFHFDNSVIKFSNSNANKHIKNLKGSIIIKKDKITFDNIRGMIVNGFMEFNGYLTLDGGVKKGYFKIFGKDFDFRNLKKKKKENEKKSIAENKKNIKKPHFLKKLYDFVQNLNIQVDANFNDIKTDSEKFRNINLNIKLDKTGVFVKNCKFLNYNKGFFVLKKGLINFNKVNKFQLFAEYNNINIGDIFNFFIPKKSFEFYGIAKNCFINIKSSFKNFKDFEKNLNGKFNINFEKGFINKVPLIANIFSILNIAQIFKFKLPDLNSNGFNYTSLKGNFNVRNGVISTESLKLISDSINLIYFGKINLVKKLYNAHLAVYPLKTVDSIVKHIPLLGYLLKDKKGSGTLVTYFRIKGPLDKPSIYLQPAKTVTKKVESVLKNIIKLPFTIFTNPEDILIPNTK